MDISEDQAASEKKGASGTGTVAHDSVHGIDLIIGVAIILACEIALGVAGGLYLYKKYNDPASLFDHTFIILAPSLVSGLITLLVVWMLVCRKYGKSFSEGFELRTMKWQGFAGSAGLGVVAALVGGLTASHFSGGKSLATKILSAKNGLYGMAVLLLVLPFVEEIYYRGFIFPVLRKKFGNFAAIAVVTLWFGLAHALQSGGEWAAVVIITAAGAVFTLQRHMTNSLTPSIVTHWMYNFSILVMVLLSRLLSRAA